MRENSLIRGVATTAWCACVWLSALTVTAANPPDQPAKSAASNSSSSTTSSTHKKKSTRAKAKKSSRRRGQKAIDAERTRQIQEALIREHYLNGSPSGKWDDATQAALRHYQSDHGWQNKTVPDSRALIGLGLGPSSEHLLNPETAMTAAPAGDAKPSAKPAIPDPPAGPVPSSGTTNPPQR